MNDPIQTTKKITGFATLTAERRTEIARMGQAAVAAAGKRHKFNSETARKAATVGWARRRGTGS